jgi:magnesium chelatase subunit D
MTAPRFPFSAVVGMDDLRLALILGAVSPGIGGVLVRGEKGTAKSTLVRALTAVLPGVDVVAGCRFSCDPAAPDPACPDGPHESGAAGVSRPARLVELPVGATEDRLAGALDLERALTEGVKAYEPGLLAAAHRGVLYVDEVNLLHDHLVDLLLDAAALGTCYVEREGVSVRHAARFLLVGTMNPEEGELRPQLLDRFGLTAQAVAPRDAGLRAEVVRRRLAYDAAPDAFAARWQPAEAGLAARIATARRLLPGVVLPDAALRQVASVCAAFEVDGLRADIVTARAAVAHAAWQGRAEVTAEDIATAARLALPHRRRRQPFDVPHLDEEELAQALADGARSGQDDRPDPDPDDRGPGGQPSGGDPPVTAAGPAATDSPPPAREPAPDRSPSSVPQSTADGSSREAASPPDAAAGTDAEGKGTGARRRPAGAAAPGAVFLVKRLEVPGIGAGAAGRRSRARTDAGRVTGALVPRGRVRRVHLAATVAAAAPHQVQRGRATAGPLRVRRADLRQPRLEGRESNLVLFVVDASGSMAARARMGAVKGAVLSLLLDAYQRRDKVGVITFRGGGAEVMLPPTGSVETAAAKLAAMPAGGRTPLAAGLARAHQMVRAERLRDPRRRPLLVLVTDGRATGGRDPVLAAERAAAQLAKAGVASVVVDCESGPVRLRLAGSLAQALGGPVLRLEELAAGPLADSVRVLTGGARGVAPPGQHSKEVA